MARHCGAAVDARDFDAVVAPQWSRRAFGHTDALRGALFARFCRKVADRFDVCVSGYNFLDFGRPAIQFVADFSFDDSLRRQHDPIPPGLRGSFHREGAPRRAYLGVVHALAGRSAYDGAEDWVVANSSWTAAVLRSRFGIEAVRVIYPPVVTSAPDIPWGQRAVGFTALGRVSREKRIERSIDILARVRAQGYDVHLHVLGRIDGDSYGREIRDKIAANADWCFAEGPVFAANKMELLARHRFAIHGRPGEAFGIAVAEQIKAGCIPFVPNQGGPAEIVGTEAITYRDEEEAVSKIVAVLADAGRQDALRDHLLARAALFSTERFRSEVRSLVGDWLAR